VIKEKSRLVATEVFWCFLMVHIIEELGSYLVLFRSIVLRLELDSR